MPMSERLDSVTDVRQWRDSIPFHYEYTAGVAGERFLRGLKEGKILAGYCPACRETSLPLRMYCLGCYGEITKAVSVGRVGRARAVTRNPEGGAFVFVTFDGVKGGIIHRLLGKTRVGGEVVALFRPPKERKCSLDDIQGFGART
jgi:hypothetical protein